MGRKRTCLGGPRRDVFTSAQFGQRPFSDISVQGRSILVNADTDLEFGNYLLYVMHMTSRTVGCAREAPSPAAEEA